MKLQVQHILILVFGLCLNSCQSPKEQEVLEDYEVSNQWAEMTLYITQYTGSNSPTYASRCLGYIGLTMYESIVQGFPNYKSVGAQLNGLKSLQKIKDGEEYHWSLALNSGQAAILKYLYNQTSDVNKEKIDSLHKEIRSKFIHHIADKAIVKRSEEFGEQIAFQIFEWSKTDGGHRAYLKNFDKEWIQPEHPGSWKPPLFAQSFSHHPLHPHWGNNRTFVKENTERSIPKMIEYSTQKNSDYHRQFITVYEKDKVLSQEEKEIALWWGDDPDDTFTPPGHSYYIASTAVAAKKPTLIQCAETYARVGLAVADAFINCWKWKYYHFTERANTYIPQNIDQEFESFWPDPPFPSFPSGHAIQAAAAATVMIDLYGNEFSFIDSSHVDRERDEVRDVDFKPRSFSSFWEVAQETADSRFYGGIHIPHDNKVGLEEGAKIAEAVNDLDWRNE